MKTKKMLLTTLFLVFVSAVCYGRDVIITVSELPAAAQQLLTKQFPGKQVSMVKKDVDTFKVSYDVLFADGTKVEFDKKGEWTEVKTRPAAVPAFFVPAGISTFVNANYPNVKIIEINRERYGYEVDLSNGLEIKFDKRFRVIDIDD